jgi:hypothetical protein
MYTKKRAGYKSREGKKAFLLYLDHDVSKEIDKLKSDNVNITIFINNVLKKHFKIKQE